MKFIPGYEKHYSITKDGKVWSYYSNKFLKPYLSRDGYHEVNLYVDSKKKRHTIHRLMMVTFIGKSKLVVNHRDGIKTNNSLVNLEYCTAIENTAHAVANGFYGGHLGEKNYSSRLTEKQAYEIKYIDKDPPSKVGCKYNIHRSQVHRIRIGKSWSHI